MTLKANVEAEFIGGVHSGLRVAWNVSELEVVWLPNPRALTATRYRLTRRTPSLWTYTAEPDPPGRHH